MVTRSMLAFPLLLLLSACPDPGSTQGDLDGACYKSLDPHPSAPQTCGPGWELVCVVELTACYEAIPADPSEGVACRQCQDDCIGDVYQDAEDFLVCLELCYGSPVCNSHPTPAELACSAEDDACAADPDKNLLCQDVSSAACRVQPGGGADAGTAPADATVGPHL